MTESPVSQTHSPLMTLRLILQQLQIDSLLVEISEDSPFEQLLVAMDEEVPPDQEPQYALQLFFANDVLAATSSAPMPIADDITLILQFMLSTPYTVPAERLLETYQLLSSFNRLLPVAAFDISQESQVYLRYGLLAESKADIDWAQVVETIELLGFFINRLVPQIAQLVEGKQSLSDVLLSTEQLLVSNDNATKG